jgi:hypothetical protein
MKYLLSETEYKELKEAKESVGKIYKILKENYDETNLQYRFDDETYRKIREAIDWQCGSAYTVDILGQTFQISRY